MDPEILTGYNIQNFDLPFLIERAYKLNIGDEFCFLGRIYGLKTKLRTNTLSSKQMGTRENKIINIEGRNPVDVMLIILRDHKLRSYSLNFVSYHFLKDQKDDVSHKMVPIYQVSSNYQWSIICVQKMIFLILIIFKILRKYICVYNNLQKLNGLKN